MEVWKASRWMTIISFILILVCLGCSVWMSWVLRDVYSYIITAFFAIAAIWLGLGAFRKRK